MAPRVSRRAAWVDLAGALAQFGTERRHPPRARAEDGQPTGRSSTGRWPWRLGVRLPAGVLRRWTRPTTVGGCGPRGPRRVPGRRPSVLAAGAAACDSGEVFRPLIAVLISSGLLVGCSTAVHEGSPTPSGPGQATTRSTSSAGTASSSAAVDAAATLKCHNSIDTQVPPSTFRVVLGVVALPASPGYPALQTSLTGDQAGPTRLFAKTGLAIKAGATFELVVPEQYHNRVGIGWGGAPSAPSQRLVVPGCTDTGGTGWLSYPGGYWIDHPGCIPLIIRVGNRSQQVSIGLGAPCPGQAPPQGPSEG